MFSEPADIARMLQNPDRQQRHHALKLLAQTLDTPPTSSHLADAVEAPLLACLRDVNEKVALAALDLVPSVLAQWSSDPEELFRTVLARHADTKLALRAAAGVAARALLPTTGVWTAARITLDHSLHHRSWRVREGGLQLIEYMFDEDLFDDAGEADRDLPTAILERTLDLVQDPSGDVRVAAASLVVVLYRLHSTDVRAEVNGRLNSMAPTYVRALLDRLRCVTPRSNTPIRSVGRAPRPPPQGRRRRSVGPAAALSAVPVLVVRTERELVQELERVEGTLAREGHATASWEARVAAMARLRGIASSDAVRGNGELRVVFGNFLRQLARPLAAQIGESRSTVVKEACFTVVELAQVAPDVMGDYVAEQIIPALLHCSIVTIQVISEKGTDCLRQLSSRLQLSYRAIHLITTAATHSAVAMRLAVAQCVGQILQNAPESERALDLLEAGVGTGIGDADSNVRALSRKNLMLMQQVDPVRFAAMLDRLEPKTRRLVKDEMTLNTVTVPAVKPEPSLTPTARTGLAPLSISHAASRVVPKTAARQPKSELDTTVGQEPLQSTDTAKRMLVPQRTVAQNAPLAERAKVTQARRVEPAVESRHDAENVQNQQTRPKTSNVLQLVPRLEGARSWTARVEALETIAREFGSERHPAVETSSLEKFLVTLNETLAATHHKVVLHGLIAIGAVFSSTAISAEILSKVLERNILLVVRLAMRSRDSRDPIRRKAGDSLLALKKMLGQEKYIRLMLRSFLYCRTTKSQECRTNAAKLQIVSSYGDALRSIEKENFAWEASVIRDTLRLVAPMTRERETCELYKAAAELLRALVVAAPDGAVSLVVREMNEADRANIQKIVVVDDDYDAASEDSSDASQFDAVDAPELVNRSLGSEEESDWPGLCAETPDGSDSPRADREIDLPPTLAIAEPTERRSVAPAVPVDEVVENSPPAAVDSTECEHSDFVSTRMEELAEALMRQNLTAKALRSLRSDVRAGVLSKYELSLAVPFLLACASAEYIADQMRGLALRVLSEIVTVGLSDPDSVAEILVTCADLAGDPDESRPDFVRRCAQRVLNDACCGVDCSVALEHGLRLIPQLQGGSLTCALKGFLEAAYRGNSAVVCHRLRDICGVLVPLTVDAELEVRKEAVCGLARLFGKYEAEVSPSLRSLDRATERLVQSYHKRYHVRDAQL